MKASVLTFRAKLGNIKSLNINILRLLTLPPKVGPLITLEYECIISPTHSLFLRHEYARVQAFLGVLGHVVVIDLPRTLRCHIYFNKIAFWLQNMGVIFAEQCMVNDAVCVQERYAEFTSDFSPGAFKTFA